MISCSPRAQTFSNKLSTRITKPLQQTLGSSMGFRCLLTLCSRPVCEPVHERTRAVPGSHHAKSSEDEKLWRTGLHSGKATNQKIPCVSSTIVLEPQSPGKEALNAFCGPGTGNGTLDPPICGERYLRKAVSPMTITNVRVGTYTCDQGNASYRTVICAPYTERQSPPPGLEPQTQQLGCKHHRLLSQRDLNLARGFQ